MIGALGVPTRLLASTELEVPPPYRPPRIQMVSPGFTAAGRARAVTMSQGLLMLPLPLGLPLTETYQLLPEVVGGAVTGSVRVRLTFTVVALPAAVGAMVTMSEYVPAVMPEVCVLSESVAAPLPELWESVSQLFVLVAVQPAPLCEVPTATGWATAL